MNYKVNLPEDHWRFTLQLGQFYINRLIYRRETGAIISPLLPTNRGRYKVRSFAAGTGIAVKRLQTLLDAAIDARWEDYADGDFTDLLERKIWKKKPYPRD